MPPFPATHTQKLEVAMQQYQAAARHLPRSQHEHAEQAATQRLQQVQQQRAQKSEER